MAKESGVDNSRNEYDPESEAMSFGTLWANALFDPGTPMFKLSRHGMLNIMLPWAGIIWGAVFGLFGLIIAAIVCFKWLKLGYIGFPIVVFVAGLFILVGFKIGIWSPMKKTTGEDLATYLMIKSRKKLAASGSRKGKVATTWLNSKVFGGEDGKLVRCDRYLGTQPLRNVPPKSPFEEDEDIHGPYNIRPYGQRDIISNEKTHYGLGRFE